LVCSPAIHNHVAEFDPHGTDVSAAFRIFAFTAALIGITLPPLTVYTNSSRLIRALALFLLLFICLSVNSVVEVTIFSTFFIDGGALAVVISMIVPSLFCAFRLSYSLPFPPANPGATPGHSRHVLRLRHDGGPIRRCFLSQ
jgi:hypothetical protein